MDAKDIQAFYNSISTEEKKEVDALPPEERLEVLAARARCNQVSFFLSIFAIVISLITIAVNIAL